MNALVSAVQQLVSRGGGISNRSHRAIKISTWLNIFTLFFFPLQLMKLMAVRRVQIQQTGKSDVPLPPAPPAHPGYAPNAALHAIKRHAVEFANPKENAVS